MKNIILKYNTFYVTVNMKYLFLKMQAQNSF